MVATFKMLRINIVSKIRDKTEKLINSGLSNSVEYQWKNPYEHRLLTVTEHGLLVEFKSRKDHFLPENKDCWKQNLTVHWTTVSRGQKVFLCGWIVKVKG